MRTAVLCDGKSAIAPDFVKNKYTFAWCNLLLSWQIHSWLAVQTVTSQFLKPVIGVQLSAMFAITEGSVDKDVHYISICRATDPSK